MVYFTSAWETSKICGKMVAKLFRKDENILIMD